MGSTLPAKGFSSSCVILPGSKVYDTPMLIHSTTHNVDVSLAQYLKQMSNASRKDRVNDQGKHKK